MRINLLKTNSREAIMAALVLFNLSLLLFRMALTETFFYGFLIWNLILAGIPYLMTCTMEANAANMQHKTLLFACSSAWLLFLPNAPYIITDFLHFKRESSMPEWFDVLLLTSFSWSGIALGFLSMNTMQAIWENRFNSCVSWVFIFCCCLLSGFGIYLGRFLRYNSWDIVRNPAALIADVPLSLMQFKTIGFSLGYGLFLFLSYSFLKKNNTNKKTREIPNL